MTEAFTGDEQPKSPNDVIREALATESFIGRIVDVGSATDGSETEATIEPQQGTKSQDEQSEPIRKTFKGTPPPPTNRPAWLDKPFKKL